MQFLRELVHSDTAATPGPTPPERSAPTPPLPPPDSDALKEETRLLKEQLNAITLTAVAAQKALVEAQTDVDYWKAEALRAVVSPQALPQALTDSASGAPAPPLVQNEEVIVLKKEMEKLHQQLDALQVDTATKIRDMHAVHTKDRTELEKELERSEGEAKDAKEENDRLRRMSDELFARIETLEAQLHAATERLRVESSKGEEARARDAVVRKAFALPGEECVDLAAGASDTKGHRGVLYITTSYVCFEVLQLLKLISNVNIKFLIKDITSLDRVPGLFGRGSALAITLRDGTIHNFTGLFNRRDIVGAILKCAEKFRPIEIHLLRNGRDHLESTRQASAASSLGLDKIAIDCPPPPSFTAYVRCPFLALFLQCSASGRIFGDAKKSPCGLWEVCVNGSQVSLKSSYNGRYLCAERALPLIATAKLSASREKAGKWEHFELVYGSVPGTFALRSAHLQYIAAAADGSFTVVTTDKTRAPTHFETLAFSTEKAM